MKLFVVALLFLSSQLLAQEPMVEFDFVDAPLAVAVENLAEQAGVRVQVDNSVQESITMSSKPIPWSQALGLIKTHFGLEENIEGGVIWLQLKGKEEMAMTKQSSAVTQPVETLQPIKPVSNSIMLYRLEHYSSTKMAQMLTEKNNYLFDSPVYAQSEKEQNTLIVRTDRRTHLQIQTLIESLDRSNPQIKIAGRIIIAKNQATDELGVRLGGRAIDGNWGIAGGAAGVFRRATNGIITPFSNNLLVDMGLNRAPSGRASIGFSDGTSLIELELQALESSGKIDIVASPQVTVLSGSEATIATGTEVPYSQIVDNDVDVLFKEALLKLVVTPTLAGAGKIHMKIVIRFDNIGRQYNGVPSIDTNQLDTQVTLQNGETLILGGIFRTLKDESKQKVPFFGDIPVLGALFRHTAKNTEKAELLVFITPSLQDN